MNAQQIILAALREAKCVGADSTMTSIMIHSALTDAGLIEGN